MILDKKIKLIILGETHGAKENIFVIKKLLRDYFVDTVCFEWQPKWFSKNWKLKSNLNLTDGRYTKEHLDLVKKIKKRVNIRCVDTSLLNNTWNQRDRIIAKNVKKIVNSTTHRVLLVVGSLHARRKTFYLKPYSTDKFIPAAFYLKNQSFSIKICYGSGYIFNNSIKPILDKRLKSYFKKNSKINYCWQKSKSKFDDYEFWVRHARACRPIT